jgi:pSer/pThr/pTyr-binding forkhead associated (FHA) protein
MAIYRLKGASGAVINDSFTLAARNVVGSAEECDLRVEQDGVSARHVEIAENESGGLVLKSLDRSAETLVNGEAVHEVGLASGDEIRIANCRWVLQAPGLRPEKVLTSGSLGPRRAYLPWLITAGLVAAAAAAWYAGLLPF